MTLPIAERLLRQANKRNINKVHGWLLEASSGEQVRAIIEPLGPMDEPDNGPKAEDKVYVRVICSIGAVASPRAVTSFTYADDETGETTTYTVIKSEHDKDVPFEGWKCEKSRS